MTLAGSWQLRLNIYTPTSGWNESFPESVAASVTLESGTSLVGLDYNEGLRAVLLDLGWKQ
jgi:hypothetical protein